MNPASFHSGVLLLSKKLIILIFLGIDIAIAISSWFKMKYIFTYNTTFGRDLRHTPYYILVSDLTLLYNSFLFIEFPARQCLVMAGGHSITQKRPPRLAEWRGWSYTGSALQSHGLFRLTNPMSYGTIVCILY